MDKGDVGKGSVNFNKVWLEEGSRVIEILGQTGPKFKRKVDDVITLEFTHEEWVRLFNLSPDYEPAGNTPPHTPFSGPTVIVSFRRTHEEKPS